MNRKWNEQGFAMGHWNWNCALSLLNDERQIERNRKTQNETQMLQQLKESQHVAFGDAVRSSLPSTHIIREICSFNSYENISNGTNNERHSNMLKLNKYKWKKQKSSQFFPFFSNDENGERERVPLIAFGCWCMGSCVSASHSSFTCTKCHQ